jgi:hypothetical protein
MNIKNELENRLKKRHNGFLMITSATRMQHHLAANPCSMQSANKTTAWLQGACTITEKTNTTSITQQASISYGAAIQLLSDPESTPAAAAEIRRTYLEKQQVTRCLAAQLATVIRLWLTVFRLFTFRTLRSLTYSRTTTDHLTRIHEHCTMRLNAKRVIGIK